MVECKKCVHYNGCVERFNERKAEGYYDEECPDITLEEHFANIAECESCVFFYEKPRAGKLELDLADGEPYKEEEYGYAYVCSVCGSISIEQRYFCHRCGSFMRGETNDS